MTTNSAQASYDPKSISDIVFASARNKQLLEDIVSGVKPFPMAGKNGILLYGTPGTGKSSLARLLPNAIEAGKTGADSWAHVTAIQNESHGKIVLGNIDINSMLVTVFSASHHYFVLDEVDLIGKAGMSALKSLMDRPNNIFIFATNNFSQISEPVKDRCHCIEFNAALAVNWLPAVKKMLSASGVQSSNDATLLAAIAPCNGSARQIIDVVINIIIQWNRRHRPVPAIGP